MDTWSLRLLSLYSDVADDNYNDVDEDDAKTIESL
jgi:hypothetical protein